MYPVPAESRANLACCSARGGSGGGDDRALRERFHRSGGKDCGDTEEGEGAYVPTRTKLCMPIVVLSVLSLIQRLEQGSVMVAWDPVLGPT